jgi:predicted MFS family arabinose efflux permease
VFFGLPLWLEQARRFDPGTAGLLILPIAGVGIVVTPLAARLINRAGARPAQVLGAITLLAGSLLLLLFGAGTAVIVLLAVGVVLGVPNGFNNLGLQVALYEHAPADQMGAVGGQFQTFRYVGAILSTALLGIVFGQAATSAGLHTLAIALAAISVLLVAASLSR